MSNPSVIVFGPTGGIGSTAARVAHEQGAKVFLAMRDVSKPIPELTPDQERDGGFERIQADLMDTESIKAAVAKSGAKHAFIYLLFGVSDGMRSAIEALKSAGIEFVVFLSSSSVTAQSAGKQGLKSVPTSDFIAFAHAQVEINLQNIFGEGGYVAVRPSYFLSNTFRWRAMIRTGEVKLVAPDVTFDYIAPADISRVCAGFLVRGAKTPDGSPSPSSVTLCGPKIASQRDALAAIGKAIGKELAVKSVDQEDEGVEVFKADGIPEHIARDLVRKLISRSENDDPLYKEDFYVEAAANVEKYSGQSPTEIAQWAFENKEQFV
ncbi:hypothetical protein M441DRAFT_57875 [Trichoderma asperellum CBS 433.97]|uniref:NmrA-like domain-containing protein n=1 Tax=Trichoderma asperellum (strain ATCC 204424 / CBS 433.97 / NBRC 101777) TaxID=1042311 RepID=A0A2T3ZAF7_TRIA4|nr:hypothetical protein M441DRAFT_57875 [Trichoderma asperellum CBS 433.97]PTB41760.1 hypothetical protein M441DRAFT_57875 [Trichoderma asperellum CBS 433.97]